MKISKMIHYEFTIVLNSLKICLFSLRLVSSFCTGPIVQTRIKRFQHLISNTLIKLGWYPGGGSGENECSNYNARFVNNYGLVFPAPNYMETIARFYFVVTFRCLEGTYKF